MTGTVKLSQLPEAGDVTDLAGLMSIGIPIKMMTNDIIELDMQGTEGLYLIVLIILSKNFSVYNKVKLRNSIFWHCYFNSNEGIDNLNCLNNYKFVNLKSLQRKFTYFVLQLLAYASLRGKPHI